LVRLQWGVHWQDHEGSTRPRCGTGGSTFFAGTAAPLVREISKTTIKKDGTHERGGQQREKLGKHQPKPKAKIISSLIFHAGHESGRSRAALHRLRALSAQSHPRRATSVLLPCAGMPNRIGTPSRALTAMHISCFVSCSYYSPPCLSGKS